GARAGVRSSGPPDRNVGLRSTRTGSRLPLLRRAGGRGRGTDAARSGAGGARCLVHADRGSLPGVGRARRRRARVGGAVLRPGAPDARPALLPVLTVSGQPRLGVTRVLVAAPRGYCAGVRRAITAVEQGLAESSAPLYVRRQIVHNAHVVGG